MLLGFEFVLERAGLVGDGQESALDLVAFGSGTRASVSFAEQSLRGVQPPEGAPSVVNVFEPGFAGRADAGSVKFTFFNTSTDSSPSR